jgi:predicted DNA-binding transcriptional regulator AlpA
MIDMDAHGCIKKRRSKMEQLQNIEDIEALTNFKKSKSYSLIKERKFPAGILIGSRAYRRGKSC